MGNYLFGTPGAPKERVPTDSETQHSEPEIRNYPRCSCSCAGRELTPPPAYDEISTKNFRLAGATPVLPSAPFQDTKEQSPLEYLSYPLSQIHPQPLSMMMSKAEDIERRPTVPSAPPLEVSDSEYFTRGNHVPSSDGNKKESSARLEEPFYAPEHPSQMLLVQSPTNFNNRSFREKNDNVLTRKFSEMSITTNQKRLESTFTSRSSSVRGSNNRVEKVSQQLNKVGGAQIGNRNTSSRLLPGEALLDFDLQKQIDDEKNLNEFHWFYTTPYVESEKRKQELIKLPPMEKNLKQYKHLDAITFAASSYKWRENEFLHKLPRLPPNSVDQIPTFASSSVPSEWAPEPEARAYYRVVAEKKDEYILVACHVNVHGFHRGDLRFLQVNDKTQVRGMERNSIIGNLFMGDLLIVTELAPMDYFNLLEKIDVSNASHELQCVWMVKKMTIMTRQIRQNCSISFLENGSGIVKGHGEVMNVVVSKALKQDKLYDGTAFVPYKIKKEYTEDIGNDFVPQLIEKASKICTYPLAFGTIFKYSLSNEKTLMFETGTDAFSVPQHLGTEESVEIVELCALMGYSAANSVHNGRCDCRSFPLIDPKRRGLLIEFSIENPIQNPTEGRWQGNNRVKFGGRCGEVNGVIENVRVNEKSRQLQITARLARGYYNFNFKTETYIVSQREPIEMQCLRNTFLSKLKDNSNGRKIIEMLYGKDHRFTIPKGLEKTTYSFPKANEEVIDLNEYQSEYVSMILNRTPLVLGSSPFGCGKSLTIVTTALEVFKKLSTEKKTKKKPQQLLVTHGNYASVNLVDIFKKVDIEKAGNPRFVRYVSESNWSEMPDNCRSDYDYPVLLRKMALSWAIGEMEHVNCKLTSETVKSLVIFVLCNNLLQPSELSGLAQNIYHATPQIKKQKGGLQELLDWFFLIYEPDILTVTADSLQGILKHLRNVITIQLDEASQVPEYTLLNLLSKFPDANYGLIGDIQQLPPYCEEDLTGRLKEYGIGETMERAIKGKMFPQATLRLVYRCHPKTTQLLSELFYNGELLSGVTENMKNEFMRKRPDFWPNANFPIMVMDNQQHGHKIGMSRGNRNEVVMVKQLIKDLTSKRNGYQLKEEDIGVISFYAGQTSVLTDALRSTDVKCGTVDAFQGSEKEVVILCCTNERLSDFMQLSNRLNVAMSRARQVTIIIGNVQGLKKATFWKTIVEKAEQYQCVKNSMGSSARKHQNNAYKKGRKQQ